MVEVGRELEEKSEAYIKGYKAGNEQKEKDRFEVRKKEKQKEEEEKERATAEKEAKIQKKNKEDFQRGYKEAYGREYQAPKPTRSFGDPSVEFGG